MAISYLLILAPVACNAKKGNMGMSLDTRVFQKLMFVVFIGEESMHDTNI